ncbi:MAG: MMPL family transporter [Candidatus Woesearchaeota archaeon]
MFSSLSAFLYARGRLVLLVAVLCAAIAGVFGASVSKRLWPYDARDPGTQSVQATNRFEAATGRQIDAGVVALVRSGEVNSGGARRRVNQVAARLRSQPDVASVQSYYSTHNRAMVSRDGRSTYVLVYFKPLSNKALRDVAQQVESRFAGQHDVVLGGAAVANAQVNTQVSNDLARAELLAFPFIFLLSLLFFRSLVAALLPPLLGGLAIVVTFFALRLVAGFVDVSVYALNFTTGIGLGLAIDYSLFMVSRYREESARLGYGRDALAQTLGTAGRTILFSSLTIAAAVASLMVFPQNFLYSMGIAGAIVAVLAATLALTVLPALLAVLGPRINALGPARLQRTAEREARPEQAGFWYRLSQVVMRRPGLIAAGSAAVLIAVGIPFWGIRFIQADARVLPVSASARQVNDILNTEFPANRTSPVQVVVGLPSHSPQVRELASRISTLGDVATVVPPASAGPHDSLLAVAPVQGPMSGATQRLVKNIRAIHTPFYVGVGGQTAMFVDLEHSLAAHLPLVLGIVIGCTLIILFLFTGSVVLPIKAVVMNFLSLSAMLGILVFIFQDGHLEGLLGFTSEGALDATQPIFLFAVGFGLATDYGVFLLSRIKEAHDQGVPNSDAVAVGLERTGRIVTAAAVLFAVALGAFATSEIVFLKELGLGAALAVLIDASIIRALLVPSLMALLGAANWWAPRPLRRLHERIGLREHGRPVPPRPASAGV